MWRWLGLFLLTSCVYAEDACASIAGDASRMRCYKRQATNQKKAPTQKPFVPKVHASENASKVLNSASENASKVSNGASNGLQPSLANTPPKIPSMKPGESRSKTGNAYQSTRADTPSQDASSTLSSNNLNASGSESHFESTTSPLGSVSLNTPEGIGFYAYENDDVGVGSKPPSNRTNALKQDRTSSSKHNTTHTELASAKSRQSSLENASQTMGKQSVEVLETHVFHRNNVQGGADDTLPSIQGTWGE